MGNIIRIFIQNHDDVEVPTYDLFINFQEAIPNSDDQAVYNIVNSVLEASSQILDDLRNYKGATEDIRAAISQPSSEMQQRRTWHEVCKHVEIIKKLYEYCQEIDNAMPQLLYPLCSGSRTPIEHCESQQALVKQFAELLHLAMAFDSLKMKNPAVQNDFSYFRRMQPKMIQEYNEGAVEMSSDTANRMSLFYASPTPMLQMLSDATTTFVAQNQPIPIENTTEYLSTLANVIKNMVENPKYLSMFKTEENVVFCVRVMVGVIILYDHVHPFGAFTRKSNIDILGAIRVIKKQTMQDRQYLLDALRFSSIHYKDESTPKSIKNLLN